MTDIAIKVEHLTKEFQIGQERSGDFRESFGNTLKTMLGTKGNKETFTALDDISFEVKKGEALGIIGRNGAGKSTLLKILSRITEPTKGRIEINGRVSSLLEVGTGFHPELTGRENIYLNGTILGMTRKEVKAKFDEIIDFSGVEKFIDTPVKHYSSGMKVRLAFSVAAHLEPEILIVDEVLAVGDAEFQKKCLGKMDDVSKKEGRTVIFVSHNMGAIQNLCERGILLMGGDLICNKDIETVISRYIGNNTNNKNIFNHLILDKSLAIQFSNFEIFVENRLASFSREYALVPSGSNIQFKVHLKSNVINIEKLYVAITIHDQNGTKVTTLDNLYIENPFSLTENETQLLCQVEQLNLNTGVYYLNLWCSNGYETLQELECASYFQVIDSNLLKTGKCHSKNKHGYVYFNQTWKKV